MDETPEKRPDQAVYALRSALEQALRNIEFCTADLVKEQNRASDVRRKKAELNDEVAKRGELEQALRDLGVDLATLGVPLA